MAWWMQRQPLASGRLIRPERCGTSACARGTPRRLERRARAHAVAFVRARACALLACVRPRARALYLLCVLVRVLVRVFVCVCVCCARRAVRCATDSKVPSSGHRARPPRHGARPMRRFAQRTHEAQKARQEHEASQNCRLAGVQHALAIHKIHAPVCSSELFAASRRRVSRLLNP